MLACVISKSVYVYEDLYARMCDNNNWKRAYEDLYVRTCNQQVSL